MRTKLLAVLIVVLLMTSAVAAQSDEQPEDPRTLSYRVCEWGLITVEEPTEAPASFITIDSPEDYSAVTSVFTVSGTGGGLIENNLMVEVSSTNGEVLFTGAALVQSGDPGETGPWSIDVDLGELTEATPIYVRAWAISPADGSTTAYADRRLNANAEFGLRFVEITSPRFGEAVSSPLMVEGQAGAAFENNLVVEVRDFKTGAPVAETVATVQTDEVGGAGPFSAEVTFDAESGSDLEIRVYQPAVADGEEITVETVQYVIFDPLGRSYDRILNVRHDDPILGAEDLCAAALAEFDNETVSRLAINTVTVFEAIAPMPQVSLSIEAAGSSVCPAPQRVRMVREDNTYAVELYLDVTYPVACTDDFVSIPQRFALGTLPNPDYTITVNGLEAPF